MNTLEQTLIESQNIYSNMARSVASRLYDVRKKGIKDSLDGFQNISHRLEEVATVRGVTFINDSKATNVNASWYALETMNRPVIWIAGGQENGNDYSILREIVRQKVKTLICIGASNESIINCLHQDIGIIAEAPDMQTAVKAAYSIGQPGDVVLLSPACASFDRFDNYAERGEHFKKTVYDL
jgi:UDP-N-acetylmuramoylalanine--D-glutamate ligase